MIKRAANASWCSSMMAYIGSCRNSRSCKLKPVCGTQELAARHARPFVDPGKLPTATALYAENTSSISKSVKALLAQHKDPHITARLQMALAIAKEDYKTAARCRGCVQCACWVADNER